MSSEQSDNTKAWAAVGLWLLLGTVFLGFVAFAQTQGDIEHRVREIASQLRCPVCQNLSVADPPSELAVQMRALIRERLERGESEAAIKAYFISKYGEWVLLSPKPKGFNLLVWVLPFAALAAGIGWACVRLRKWVRRREVSLTPELTDLRIQEWLHKDSKTRNRNQERGLLEKERVRLLTALKELDFDFRSGKLSEQDYHEMKRLYENRALALHSSFAEAQHKPPSFPKRQAVAQENRASEGKLKKSWLVPAAGVLLIVFGVGLGLLLARSIQSGGEQDSITGGPLTGTRELSDNPASLLRLGREAYQRQQYDQAITAFKKVLALNPSQPDALSFMGLLMAQTGHLDLGLSYVERALAAQPQNPLALEIKGAILYKGKGDHEGAIRVWEELLRDDRLSKEQAAAISQWIVEARAAMQKETLPPFLSLRERARKNEQGGIPSPP
ncbi:tetratricopeptide repeat protein [bacterium]|nr:MAG: tetratricopeptide repeat protein [bacterium]